MRARRLPFDELIVGLALVGLVGIAFYSIQRGTRHPPVRVERQADSTIAASPGGP